ncbi:putative bifunctional diguanylate cyclase/phosphodiesterase [Actinoplanes awajinensis]|uniref:Diguanylate cyclase n=1 Tax=Actinoplanes awajinensis subsp. mycoplanecinus TaxID=135947 RepID=A0A101J7A8_9ACTN|nr:bifunctional diguanylate cyclase/phosphodiesterase [Actinoplanes awajinensis]KUL21515.1 diguanylate cyclase [Actinoplanes awajinensis subsp. mycoplanecinus]
MRLPYRPARAAGLLVAVAVGWLLVAVLLGVAGVVATVPAWSLWPVAVASSLTSTAGCLLAAATGTGAGRVFWRRMGAAFVVLAAALISQSFDTMRHLDETVAMGPLTGVLLAAAVGIVVVALIRLPGERRTWRATVPMWLDVSIVMLAASLVMMQVLIELPVPVEEGPLAGVLRLISVGAAVAAVLAIVRVGMSRTGSVHGRALWILSPVGVLGPVSMYLAVAFDRWDHLNATVAILPPLGVLVTVSTLTQTRANRIGAAPGPVLPQGRRGDVRKPGISRIPYVAVALTAVMMVGVTVQRGYLPAGLAGGAVCLIVLVLIRQHAALSDNSLLADRLADQARYDDLTGCPNRRHFTDALHQRTAATTVAVCDLDDFTALNDRLGDDTGDEILRQAAERIAGTVGEAALVARLLGDEFGVLLPDGHPLAEGDRLAVALLLAFQEPLPVDEHDLLVTVTVGAAAGRDEVVPDLLRRAELALQAAQRVGTNRYQAHTPDLDASAQHHADVAAALRHGMERGEFRLLYQPIVELPLGTMRAVEALVRWHPDGGKPVSPAEFIPVAEQTGLIVDLGAWILDTACADAADWQRRHGASAPLISVNVSARQLLDPDLPDLVAATLVRHGLDPDQVTLEITETAVFAGGTALNTVHALRDLGVGIALDDFGTGHSSLTLLRTCPVTTLKVDKSFIDELNGSPQQEAIAASLSGIAATLGLRAVAEGVETQNQADRLYVLGYRYAQGFHFARPMPAADIDASLLTTVG